MDRRQRFKTTASLIALAVWFWATPRNRAMADETDDASVEIGAFGGVAFLSEKHGFYEFGSRPRTTFERKADQEFGLRLGYYPLACFGLELEGAFVRANTSLGIAKLWIPRGHLVARIPGTFSPFVLVGGGAVILDSNDAALGDAVDPEGHWGVGLQIKLTERLRFRVEGRHLLAKAADLQDQSTLVSHFEALGSLSVLLAGELDQDKDGVTNSEDLCPHEAGHAPDGCPIQDEDKDGVKDDEDHCPDDAGSAAHQGCPDPDGDGISSDQDRCPDAPGIAPDGCPDLDPDKDGISGGADVCPHIAGVIPHGCPDEDPDRDGVRGESDQCPGDPETANGFEDQDGCPDTVPEAMKRFTGSIRGITFRSGRATIKQESIKILDEAIEVLNAYPDVRIEVGGHTDSVGSAKLNQAVSQKRAQAVKNYLVQKGITQDRIEVKGYGEANPIAPNKTRRGRARNRRIEFQLLRARAR